MWCYCHLCLYLYNGIKSFLITVWNSPVFRFIANYQNQFSLLIQVFLIRKEYSFLSFSLPLHPSISHRPKIIFHVFTHATFRFFKPTAVLKLLRPHRKHSFSAPACLFSLTYFPSLHYSKHFLSTHCAWNISYLTHFMPLASVDTPWKQKTKGFLIFSGGIERDHWHEMC